MNNYCAEMKQGPISWFDIVGVKNIPSDVSGNQSIDIRTFEYKKGRSVSRVYRSISRVKIGIPQKFKPIEDREYMLTLLIVDGEEGFNRR